MRYSIIIRPATLADEEALAQLLRRAACLYPGSSGLTARALLDHSLLVTAWEGERLRGCLGVSLCHPPMSRIEAIAIRCRRDVDRCLRELLPSVEVQLRERGTETLAYIGQAPWLIAALKRQGFQRANSVLLFRKRGWEVPHPGNHKVCVRPATPEDIPALVSLDEAAFREALWRNNADAFQQCLSQMPHFVVVEQKGQVVGYQLSHVQGDEGYVARVVVHPEVQGQRIGARLVAEAIHFFQERGVRNIALNTQRDNYRAQRLYGWFGFRPAGQEAVVLQKRIGESRVPRTTSGCPVLQRPPPMPCAGR